MTTALDRKAAALQNLEAEKGRLAVSLKHAEEVVKELTHAQLEGTAQDAAARKAQHVNEVRYLQVLHLSVLPMFPFQRLFSLSVCVDISSPCSRANRSAQSPASSSD